MFIIDKTKLEKFCLRSQRNFCGYDSYGQLDLSNPPPPFCDCKYGAKTPNVGRSEKTGCPELRCVTELFSLMTEEEYTTIMKRGNHIIT